jgi:hypothetical protein
LETRDLQESQRTDQYQEMHHQEERLVILLQEELEEKQKQANK